MDLKTGRWRRWAAIAPGWIALSFLLVLPSASLAGSDIASCSKRIAKGLKSFSSATAEILGDCEIDDLEDDEIFVSCAEDEEVLNDRYKANSKLWREVRKCGAAAIRAVCPLGAKTLDELSIAVDQSASGPGLLLESLMADLFKTNLNGLCSRPVATVSKKAEECASRLVRVVEEVNDDALKCHYKCELSNLRSSYREPCVDPDTNLPSSGGKLESCLERSREDLQDVLTERCIDDDASSNETLLTELGCPLGESRPDYLAVMLWERMYRGLIELNTQTFRSSCKSNLDGEESPDLIPAVATLSPSGIQTTVTCGQVLDRVFFPGASDERDDTDLDFESNLDCRDATTGVDGFVINHGGVKITGREKWSIEGPRSSRLRTGFGIRIATGISDVAIKKFRAIQRFAVGIGDVGFSDNINIDSVGLRRNVQVGVRLSASRVRIENIRADRNNIGLEISGRDSSVLNSRITRSEGVDGIGMILGLPFGDTLDQVNPRAVRVSSVDFEGNQGVGLWITGGAHQVEESDFVANGSDGIRIDGWGSKIESNSIKSNGGNGITLYGTANELTANRSDLNGLAGYSVGIGALLNDLNNNGAGTPTDQGNLGVGFEIFGSGTIVENNRAEANGDQGFYVATPTSAMDGNYAGGNRGVGFEIAVSGNNLDTNVAERNDLAEFVIAAGNVDGQGNRANGATFDFGPEGTNGVE
jgi:hypothetical protein